MENIGISYKDIPYVGWFPKDGRGIMLTGYYDHKEARWFYFTQLPNGEYIRLNTYGPVEGTYFSEKAVNEKTDALLPIINFYAQHVSFPQLSEVSNSLEDDFNNLCAVLEKYHLISLRPADQREGSYRLVVSEFEYLTVLIRSVYDLLQQFARELFPYVLNLTSGKKLLKNKLPTSFSDFVKNNSAEEMKNKYGMPDMFVEFYLHQAERFRIIKGIRDSIVHFGQSNTLIFDLDEGLAVDYHTEMWAKLPMWNESVFIKEKMGSLRAIFAKLIFDTINATTEFTKVFSSGINLPPPIYPNCNLYLRNPFSRYLIQLPEILAQPWERLATPSQ